MFVWMAKFGAAYGVRTGIHVGVDVLVNRLPAERRRFILFGLLAVHCSPASSARSARALSGRTVFTICIQRVWTRRRRHAGRTDYTRSGVADLDRLFRHAARFSLMCFRFLQVAGRSGAPANCRTTITVMSMASKKRRRPCRTRTRLAHGRPAPARTGYRGEEA